MFGIQVRLQGIQAKFIYGGHRVKSKVTGSSGVTKDGVMTFWASSSKAMGDFFLGIFLHHHHSHSLRLQLMVYPEFL